MKYIYTVLCTIILSLGLSACSPEVGSKGWCKEMDSKPKMDWSTRELKDYAKHCLGE